MTPDPREPTSADFGDVTALLRAWSRGDPEALERLLPLVYKELRRLAAAQMRKERPGHTLQPTALVHEAYFKLVGRRLPWKDRGHFYGVAARAMREVLVDHARRRGRRKRLGGGAEIPLDGIDPGVAPRAVDLLALDEALQRLSALDERQARLVELRAFAGLTVEEAAGVLECSEAAVRRDYRHAEAWLRRAMRSPAT
jgi:RNA polymerase sigma-70 factor (ECF subfamily)